MSEPRYATGGYVGGGEPVTIRLDPHECLLKHLGDGKFACTRVHHIHGDQGMVTAAWSCPSSSSCPASGNCGGCPLRSPAVPS